MARLRVTAMMAVVVALAAGGCARTIYDEARSNLCRDAHAVDAAAQARCEAEEDHKRLTYDEAAPDQERSALSEQECLEATLTEDCADGSCLDLTAPLVCGPEDKTSAS